MDPGAAAVLGVPHHCNELRETDMTLPATFRTALLAAAALALTACQPGALPGAGVVNRAGFKANYLVARAALEKGQYGRASRQYASLLPKAGPLAPRIRLEYAHSLLREGKFEKASEEARVVASQLDGRGRSAALAVQATADQEIGRAAINRSEMTAEAVQRLVAARDAFDEVLTKHPDLDPLGGLKLRRKTLDVELSTIR